MAREKNPTERVPVTLTSETISYLEDLVRIGTHGTTVPGVARTLIEQGVRDAIEKAFISQRELVSSNKK
jgi:hypothetical protein